MNIISTIVGSYPTRDYKPESFNEKILNSLGLFDPYKKAIIQAVNSFVCNDIDIICDGQVRGDMIKIFASKINGMEIIDNTVYIHGKITPAAHPISVGDLKLTYNIAKSMDNKFKLNASLDEIFKHNQKGVKGIITGPTTIVHSSSIDNFYTNKSNAVIDTAKALKHEALELQKAGACLLQIDEPFVSIGVEDINVSKKAVEIISNAVDIPVVLHVCGNLENVMEDLLFFDVDILDFEFAGMCENIQTLKKYWDNQDKLIGIGCIDTKKEEKDNVDEVTQTIKNVLEIINPENAIIDPDCGMRMLPENIAKDKLEVLNNSKRGIIDG